MGRMEEYYLWKKGELNKKLSRETIDLFKTNLNDEQLIALEKYDKKILIIVLCALCIYFVVGVLYGYLGGVLFG